MVELPSNFHMHFMGHLPKYSIVGKKVTHLFLNFDNVTLVKGFNLNIAWIFAELNEGVQWNVLFFQNLPMYDHFAEKKQW